MKLNFPEGVYLKKRYRIEKKKIFQVMDPHENLI